MAEPGVAGERGAKRRRGRRSGGRERGGRAGMGASLLSVDVEYVAVKTRAPPFETTTTKRMWANADRRHLKPRRPGKTLSSFLFPSPHSCLARPRLSFLLFAISPFVWRRFAVRLCLLFVFLSICGRSRLSIFETFVISFFFYLFFFLVHISGTFTSRHFSCLWPWVIAASLSWTRFTSFMNA